jgi:hypothetical protein
MGSFGNYLENELLDHILGNGVYTPPTIYIALSTIDPTDDGSGLAEPTYSAYARVQHDNWSVATSRATHNIGDLTFPQKADGLSETISYWAAYDAASGGNMLAQGAFSLAKELVQGNTPIVPSGLMTVSITTSGMSNYLSNEILDHVFGNGAFTPPTNLYVGFSTADPTDDGSGISEPSGNNYARVNHNAWDIAVGGASENSGVILFPVPSGNWGTITFNFISDDPSAGNILFYGALQDEQAPDDGDTVQYSDGDLDITLD